MAISLIAIGILLTWVGVRGNASALYSLIGQDFKSGFLYWMLAILAIGFLGQVAAFKDFAVYLMVLVLIVLVLHNSNAISNLESALKV